MGRKMDIKKYFSISESQHDQIEPGKLNDVILRAKPLVAASGSTILMSAKKRLDGNGLFLFGGYLSSIIRVFILVQIWKSLADADLGGLTLSQLLTYSLMGEVLRPLLDIWTPATEAIWEGSIISRYVRPMPISLTLVAESVGLRWIPGFLFLSAPLLCVAFFMGISISPVTVYAGALTAISLFFSVIIGYAMDIILASLAVPMKNGAWAMIEIRQAIVYALSGRYIPFSMFPANIGAVFALLPFGSIASAPLNIYIGSGDAARMIYIQAAWAIVMTAIATRLFKRAEEEMISLGG
jgi:ABC-2 type transport system permease protein